MKNHAIRRARQLGLVATLGLAAILASAGPARASNAASATIVGRTLNVNGSSGPDDIVLSVGSADPSTLLVDIGNDGTIDQQFDRTTFDAINVSLGAGNDRFSAAGVPMAQTSTIDGGSGDDTIVGTEGTDTITGGSGNDHISAGAGDDVIGGGSGADFVVGGLGHDTAVLDSGDDTFLWNPGEGSDDVDGRSGTDTLLFNGANGGEIMSLSAVGTRAVFLRSPGNITMNLDNVDQLDLHALGGADQITVNDMTGTRMRQANIDLSGSGNGGAGDGSADLVTVNGTNKDDRVNVVGQGALVDVSGLQTETRITGSEAADHLQVSTLDGNDTVTVDPSALALIGVTTDLGAGQL
jgi:hypothetical protein